MKPNIIFILMDDLGWKDLRCQGSDFYETPNLDWLVAQGMRFTDAYAACPVCSPSRASLMTGKYPARLGLTDWIDWHGHCHPAKGSLIDAEYCKALPEGEMTLAKTLRQGGYTTWHVGKWHLGHEQEHWPDAAGFDVNIGGCGLGMPTSGYFSPWKIPAIEDEGLPEGVYLPDYLTDRAIDLIRGRSGQPFYLNLWYYLVHVPIQAKPKDIQRFEKKAKQMGLDQIDPFQEGSYFPCEHKKDQRIIRRTIQSDPRYAAMIWNMDWNIGRVLNALREKDELENTLILFSSDNGGLATAESSPTCNAPLEEGKGWMYEGGTRVPLIANWPGRIRPGSICDVPVTSPDIYPTVLEAAGLPSQPAQHVDGESLLPLLQGSAELEREAIYWHYPHYGNQGGTPSGSIRAGAWKLIEFFEDTHVELYNLRNDISESHNLAASQPEIVCDLRERLHAWQREVGARMPKSNPEYVPWTDRAPAGHLL